MRIFRPFFQKLEDYQRNRDGHNNGAKAKGLQNFKQMHSVPSPIMKIERDINELLSQREKLHRQYGRYRELKQRPNTRILQYSYSCIQLKCIMSKNFVSTSYSCIQLKCIMRNCERDINELLSKKKIASATHGRLWGTETRLIKRILWVQAILAFRKSLAFRRARNGLWGIVLPTGWWWLWWCSALSALPAVEREKKNMTMLSNLKKIGLLTSIANHWKAMLLFLIINKKVKNAIKCYQTINKRTRVHQQHNEQLRQRRKQDLRRILWVRWILYSERAEMDYEEL